MELYIIQALIKFNSQANILTYNYGVNYKTNIISYCYNLNYPVYVLIYLTRISAHTIHV